MRMTKKTALALTGHGSGLGNPSKMPGRTTAISANLCKQGMKLAKVKGSVCHGCYAMKNNYQYPSVKTAHQRRFLALTEALTNAQAGRRWVGAMAFLINKSGGEAYFRWHDAGDIQSPEHLRLIFRVCHLTPNIRHWLPTREVAMVREVLKDTTPPPNLTIRISSFMVGAGPMRRLPTGVTTSTVDYTGTTSHCPAYKQDGKCGDCRNCWDKSVANVNYPKH